jgi:hypothetical protein
MARPRKYYLKNNYLTLRSKPNESHYGMWHTALWPCTHIPNIIDLSRKTKKLWSRQASLTRSRRSAITFLSFEIGQWYLVCGCMTTRSVLCTIMTFVWTLTSRSNNCFFRDRSIPRMSLWYTTHHLMVMHPHIKYHWPI